MKQKSQKFEKNIAAQQRGIEPPKKKDALAQLEDDEEKPPLSPFLLGLLLFVVVGSALFQVLLNTQSGGQVE